MITERINLTNSYRNMRVLVFGHIGWIGSQLVDLLKTSSNVELILSNARLDDYGSLIHEFNRSSGVTHCLLAAGLTGRPNVDWCEDNKRQVIRVNVIGTSIVADLCNRRGIHLTFLSTGCIYEYDERHPIGGPGFVETDEPNFNKSFYSHTKILVERIVTEFPTTLVLRIRMPLSDDMNDRNFITKITRYDKVVNVPNSMTVLHDLLPIIPDMMERGLCGVFNFCNPGAISHNEILDLYKKYIDPNFVYQNFSVEEQSSILKAGRSNNCLDVTKLVKEYPQIEPIGISIVKLFERMKVVMSNS